MALGKKRDRADRPLTLAQVYHVVLKALDATWDEIDLGNAVWTVPAAR